MVLQCTCDVGDGFKVMWMTGLPVEEVMKVTFLQCKIDVGDGLTV